MPVRFTFVSNYINHHQIPFCEAMCRNTDIDFVFLETEHMERERLDMGWEDVSSRLPYVRRLYDDEEAGIRLVADSDMVMMGWTERSDLAKMRLESGKSMVRVSERIYKEGQWKAISPRGLMSKYNEHTKWHNAPCWMLCAGAYVASDFALIHAYTGKMFKWGYFPELRSYTEDKMAELKAGSPVRLLYAGRFVPGYKHPEFAVALAKHLKSEGVPFRLDIIGSGEMKDEIEREIHDGGLEKEVVMHGFLPPEEVRSFMERAHVFLFPSNHLEGWGAVLNEAMNSGCAVVAGSEAGATPFLIKHGQNGLVFDGENEKDFIEKSEMLVKDRNLASKLGRSAQNTVNSLWNADRAADELIRFTRYVLTDPKMARTEGDGVNWAPPAEGPMSVAKVIKPYVKVTD